MNNIIHVGGVPTLTGNLLFWSIRYRKSTYTNTGIIINTYMDAGQQHHLVLKTPSNEHNMEVEVVKTSRIIGLHNDSSNISYELGVLKQINLIKELALKEL